MVRSKVQVQDTMDGTDTEMSDLCDKLLSVRDEVSTVQEELHSVESKLIEVMNAKGMKSVKHGGKLIKMAHTEEKNKIQVKTV
jgi:hypothetical protein